MLTIFNFKFKFKLLLFGILLSFEFLMISPVKASTFEIDSLCYVLIDNNSVEITGTLLDNDYKSEIIIPSAILIDACEYNVVKIG